jgi:hypothetical protein
MTNSQVPNFLDNAYLQNQINTPSFALDIGNISEASILYYNEIPNHIL